MTFVNYILLFILRQHLLYLSKRLCLYIKVCLPFISNKLSILQLIAMLFISWQSEHLTDSYLLMGKYMFLLTVDKFSWISILLLLFPLELQLVNLKALHIWRHCFATIPWDLKHDRKNKNNLKYYNTDSVPWMI